MLKVLALIVCLFIISITASDVDYIMALKSPVTQETYSQAKEDVIAVGGKVTYEFRAAFKALLVRFPKEHINTLSAKPYVDFIEEDKSVHTYDNIPE